MIRTMPTAAAATPLLQVPLRAADGAPTSLVATFAGRRLVVVFLRHFG
jgi:hypothetical protein